MLHIIFTFSMYHCRTNLNDSICKGNKWLFADVSLPLRGLSILATGDFISLGLIRHTNETKVLFALCSKQVKITEFHGALFHAHKWEADSSSLSIFSCSKHRMKGILNREQDECSIL